MKTLTMVNLLLFVSVAAALGWERIDPKQLEVGASYRVDSLTPMTPEMKEADPMATFSKVKRIPPGGAFKIDSIEKKYRDTWYKVRAISASRQAIGTGYINSKVLVDQKLTQFGSSAVTVTRAKPKVVKPVVDANAKPYRIASSTNLNYRTPGSTQVVKRAVFNVLLSKEMSDKDLHTVTQEIVEGDAALDAAYIYYYLPNTPPAGAYTAGRVLWAPSGVWEDAGSETRKRFIIDHGDAMKKLAADSIVSLPDKKKMAIFAAMMRIVELDGDFTQARAAVAKTHNVKVSDLKKITDEGLLKNWPMR